MWNLKYDTNELWNRSRLIDIENRLLPRGGMDWEFGTSRCCCCCCSVAQSYPTLCNPMDCSTPGFPVLYHLSELAQTHVHWVSDAIQPSHPLSSPSPPALSLSQHQGLFQWVRSSHLVPKYWSFSFSISPSNEYAGLISFRMDCFGLLAVQGTLKRLLQCYSSILYIE